MVQAEKLRFCKGDLVAVGIVLALAVVVMLCFLPGNEVSSSTAEIYLNGDLVRTVDLTQDQTFEITAGYCNVIRVENGAIFIEASDCPGQDCVHSGRISTGGRILVCLPNGLEIRIVSEDADVDFVVG